MWMAGSPGPISELGCGWAWARPGQRASCLVLKPIALGLLLLLCAALPASSRERAPGVDFLNERLRMPESERYDEGAYIESGVGLPFGVDKRLLYYSGKYEEAIVRFEAAVKRFRYKSEIWVYLARSHFYMKSPHHARAALERAAEVMPDLQQQFWGPMIEGLLWEIRKRANEQQIQIAFYSTDQDAFLSLFRLYRFLEDAESAVAVMDAALARAKRMRDMASVASEASRRSYLVQATKWQELAHSFRAELVDGGVVLPEAEKSASSALPIAGRAHEGNEHLRLLQMKVDFYPTRLEDYQTLFNAYLARDMVSEAAGVIDAASREIQRIELRASIAPDPQAEAKVREEIADFEQLQKSMREHLEIAPAPGAAQVIGGPPP